MANAGKEDTLKKLTFIILTLSSFIFIGCAARLYNPVDDSRALVYGYIDMEAAPTELSFITFKQVLPKTSEPFWHGGTDGKGLFWHDQLPPGTYQMVNFGGSSFWRNANYTYNMPEFEKNETAVKIKGPGLHYVGTYKFKKEGTFFSPKFDLTRSRAPSEKELLEKLLPLSAGTPWEARIKKRIKELK